MHQPSGLGLSCTVSIQCTTRTRSVRWLHVQLQTCCQQHHQFTTYCGVTLKSEQTTCQIKCGDRWIYLHLHKYVCMGYIVCMQYACRNLIQSFCFHSQVACLWTDLSLDLGLIEHKHAQSFETLSLKEDILFWLLPSLIEPADCCNFGSRYRYTQQPPIIVCS